MKRPTGEFDVAITGKGKIFALIKAALSPFLVSYYILVKLKAQFLSIFTLYSL
jgi:hypothetical protein